MSAAPMVVVGFNDLFLDEGAARVLPEDEQDEVEDQDEAADGAERDARDGAGGRGGVEVGVRGRDGEDVLLAFW